VIRSRLEIEEEVAGMHGRLVRAMRYRLLLGRQAVTALSQHRGFAQPRRVINQRLQRLDELTFRVERAQRGRLEQMRRQLEASAAVVRHFDVRRMLEAVNSKLDASNAALVGAMNTQVLRRRGRLVQLQSQLEALSPTAILERGYALVFDDTGKLLTDAAAAKPGSEIRARLARGQFTADVKTVFPEQTGPDVKQR
jgi:exodeoxyribonuclease VII large subunit